jgi:predicted nuclease of restriction endonuclease-like (RecB) superfamily
MEDRLIERLRVFILELGYGFCFIGRQHRLTPSIGVATYTLQTRLPADRKGKLPSA